MIKIRSRGENIRKFILETVEKHPSDIARVTADHFGVTRQAVNKHLQSLVEENALTQKNNTKNKIYTLVPVVDWQQSYKLADGLAEDIIWRNDIKPQLGSMPENVLRIWDFGFTEMFNNAIDHSGASEITVKIKKTAFSTEMLIFDNGLGIFKKIQTSLNLLDERHALLELSKGKLTTDPKRHTGEGIFFTSRMFDSYNIFSGEVSFFHEFGEREDWIFEKENSHGTMVWMKLNNHTSRTMKKIFDEFSSGEDYGFTKTVVPVKLAQYGDDQLISRSQAKRLLARVELFKTVIFNFKDVEFIGQAFADEIFRVFALAHPELELIAVNTRSEVKQMIERAKAKLSE